MSLLMSFFIVLSALASLGLIATFYVLERNSARRPAAVSKEPRR